LDFLIEDVQKTNEEFEAMVEAAQQEKVN
jgi:hypothetical protein